MFNIGIGELLFIGLLALIVLGPERLPQIMRQLGGYAHDLRTTLNQLNREFAEELKPIQEIRSLVDELNPARQIGNTMEALQTQPTIAPPATLAAPVTPAAVMAATATTQAAVPFRPSDPMAQLRGYMLGQTPASGAGEPGAKPLGGQPAADSDAVPPSDAGA